MIAFVSNSQIIVNSGYLLVLVSFQSYILINLHLERESDINMTESKYEYLNDYKQLNDEVFIDPKDNDVHTSDMVHMNDLGNPIEEVDDSVDTTDDIYDYDGSDYLIEELSYTDRKTAIKELSDYNEPANSREYFVAQTRELIRKYPEAFGFPKGSRDGTFRVTSRFMEDHKILYSTWLYNSDKKVKASSMLEGSDLKAFDKVYDEIITRASKIADQLIKEEIVRRGDDNYPLYEIMGFSYEYRNGDLYVWLVN